MSDEIKICTPKTSHPSVPLDALVSRILILAEAMCEKNLFQYQKEFGYRIIEAVLLHDGEMITALLSRQSGKSEIIGATVAACGIILPTLANTSIFADDWRLNCTDDQGNYRGYKNGIRIGIYAPIQEQADIAFTRVKDTLVTETSKQVANEIGVAVNIANGNKLWMSNGTKIRSQSASENSKIEGESYHLLILDESQDIGMVKIRKCFAASTEFIIDGGKYASIEKVVKNKLSVLSTEGLVVPTEFHDNGIQKVYEITTDNGRKLRVTANHRNLVVTRTKKVPFFVETHELESGYRIAIPDSTPVFGTKGTYSQGRLFGMLLGNGCMTGDKPQLMVHKECLSAVEKDCSEFQVSPKIYGEPSPDMLALGLTQDCNSYNSNQLTAWLRDIGVWGIKGHKKYVPNKKWSKEFLKGLIEGLIITDGSVECCDVKPVISFANSSRHLVKFLQNTLLKFGVHCSWHESFVANSGTLPGSPKHPGTYMYLIHIKCVLDIKRFYKQFNLLYKQSRLESAYDTIRHKIHRQHSDYYPKTMRFACIKSIKYAGKEHTFCVTVPTKDHLVVANGVLSSNSLHPMIAAYNGTLVKIGTCSIEKSDFYLSIKANKRQFAQGGKKNHFEYNYKICEMYNSMYKQFIEKEKVRLGEESDEFLLSYTCTWLLERGQFITDKQLMNSKVAMVTGKYRHLYRNSPRHITAVAGIDFGKVHDPTVVTVLAVNWANPIADEWIDTPETSVHFVAYQKHIISWQMILGDNYEDQFTQITQYLSCFKGLCKITVDATGVGQWGLDKFIVYYSNFDRGKAMDGSPDISYVEVEGFNFNLSSKSEGYKILHADLATGRTTFPAGLEVRETRLFRRFVGEMLDLRKNYRNGYMCCEAPCEPGAHDDFCMTGLSPVQTLRGQIPIKDVIAGDMVLTRKGWKPVLANAQTGVKKVIRVGNLVATENHPFYCVNKERFIPLAELSLDDTILSCESSTLKSEKSDYSKDKDTTDIHTQKLLAQENILREKIITRKQFFSYIELFGNIILGLSKKAVLFIIKTMMELTTELVIWKNLRSVNMLNSTCEIQSDWLAAEKQFSLPEKLQENLFIGNLKKEEKRKEQRRLNVGPRDHIEHWSALSVLKSSKREIGLTPKLVPMLVRHVVGDSATLTEFEKLMPNDTVHVYNLSVQDAKEFVCQGVLVHNCDSLMLANWGAQAPSDLGVIDVSQNRFFGAYA